MNNLPGQMTV